MICACGKDLAFIFDYTEPGRHVQGRGVAAVAIDDKDAFKPVVGEAAADIFDVVDKSVPTYGYGAVEIHVMRTITMVYGRYENHF